LRKHGFAVGRAFDGRSMKAQMKVADKSGARLALILGEQELAANEITIRDLRSVAEEKLQVRVSLSELHHEVARHLAK
jgi:histidyl-tRNA synthetase